MGYNFPMRSQLSRRDFLKLGGLTLGGLAFSPFLPGLTDFDDSFILRVATADMPVHVEPTEKSGQPIWHHLNDLVHVYEQITAKEPAYNPVWYRVWGGYMHRGRVQRVKTLYQTPVTNIPADQRLLMELTVPYATPYWFSKAYGWKALTPPLYYGSVHWVEAVEEGPKMADYSGPWYRIFDELDSNVPYYVPAIYLCVMPPSVFTPITPDVPYEQKLIEVNLSTQMLYAYENGTTVFQTNISSGIPGGAAGANGISTTTPIGKFTILDKVPAKHMGNSYFSVGHAGNLLADADNYVLPGIPWSSFFTSVGHAFHGTYWHENFGWPMSHGCINMRSNEANWVFRWAKPAHSDQSISNHGGRGTMVEIHY